MTTVRIYSKPRCVQCDATKRRLDEKGIPYIEEDATDPANTEAIKALGYQQAPVVIVSYGDPKNEEHWSGFRPDLIDLLAERAA